MAQLLHQIAEVQQTFAARIQQKVAEQRDVVQERAEDVPLVGWLLKPIAGFAFDMEERSNSRKGERGEESVLDSVLRSLPASWFVFHNVVVALSPDDFAQIDVLALGPAGVLLIETKAWRGSYKAYRDSWKMRQGSRWTNVNSPTAQVQRQSRKLSQWLAQHRLPTPKPADGWIVPTVVFTQAEWLGVKACSVQVFDGKRALLAFLKEQPEGILSPAQVSQLCDLIVRSPAPEPQPRQPQAATVRSAPSPATPALQQPVIPQNTAPNCPKCGTPMVLRTARHGTTVGQQFYGCKHFPRCREVLQLGQQPVAVTPHQAAIEPANVPIPSSPQPIAVASPSFAPVYRCGACQGEVSRTATFCQHCGSRLSV